MGNTTTAGSGEKEDGEMLSVLTLNHRMHTGSFLTKVTRNRAIDLHCIQQEIMLKTLLDACVALQCLQVAGEHRGQAGREMCCCLPLS